MTEPEHLLSELENTRRKIMEMLPKAELYRDKEIFPGWTLKEILAHMTGWDDVIIRCLHAHSTGNETDTPSIRSINAYNAEVIQTCKTADYEHTRKDWESRRETLMELIRDLPADRIATPFAFPWGGTGTVADVVKIFVHHEKSHARDITSWLKNLHQPSSEDK